MNLWIINGVLAVATIFLFFFFSTRRKYREASAAQNYHKLREKLTLREEEPEEEEIPYGDSGGLRFPLGSIIGGLTVLVMGLTLLPTITEELTVATASNVTQVSGATETLIGIIPIFFVIALSMTIIGIVITGMSGFRSGGLV